MSIYLVTGGAGFIGSNLVRALIEAGEEVRVLDDFSTGRRENLAGLEGRFQLIEGDLRDPAAVRRAVEGAEFVLHQGALPSVPRSVADPLTTNEVNVRGTLNLLLAARDGGVRRVVYASSSSVYGDTPVLPKEEGMKPQPLSPYALSKLAGEQYCGIFTRLYGLETVALRYFNVFGPRQDPSSQYAAVVPKFLQAMSGGRRPTIYGDGTQSRDFTHVENVVEANLLACRAPGAAGLVANLACGERVDLNQLVALLNGILGTSLEPEYAAARPGDVKHSLADIGLAARLLGYRPRLGLEEGLERLARWARESGAF